MQQQFFYDNLAGRANFPVTDVYVSFTCTFRDLGLLINYSLRNNATAVMGALKEVWLNPHLDIYNKYLLFRAIPMNLLLWGTETWSLQKTQLDKLEVFLHRSIRQILHFSMSTVHEDRIRNEKMHDVLFHPLHQKHDRSMTS
jgi:hypothetical protein